MSALPPEADIASWLDCPLEPIASQCEAALPAAEIVCTKSLYFAQEALPWWSFTCKAGQRRRGGGAKPAGGGCFAIAKSNVAGFEYQYGGGTWRRKSSSAAFIAAMVLAA